MPERGVETAIERGPARLERAGAKLGGKATRQLVRLIEAEYRARGEALRAEAKLTERARALLDRALERDAEAKVAWRELQRRKLATIGMVERRRAAPKHTYDGPMPSSVPSLHPGVNILAPPYDFQITTPTKGKHTAAMADRLAGTHELGLGHGIGGMRYATSGLGVVLRSPVQGVVRIRPAWGFACGAWIDTEKLGANTEGGVRVTAQDAVTGQVLKTGARSLWSFEDDVDWHDNGFLDPWALGIDFFVNANQAFSVSFLSSAFVDDSGFHWPFSFSSASAWLEMRIPLVVVEVGP